MKLRLSPAIILAAMLAVEGSLEAWPVPAQAQSILTAVNGDPITTFDVEQYAKILRLSRKAASSNDALEAAIADHLKYIEARRNGVDASDSDMQTALGRLASDAKMRPEVWLGAAQKTKIDTDTIRNHLRAMGAWNAYVRNRNKTLDVSEGEVSAQLARQGTNAKITDYDLREVVLVVPINANPSILEARLREAQSLRNRFADCESGLPLAKALPNVAIKQRTDRASDALSEAMRNVLSETPRGHLTPPQRSASGIEMVAVCNKVEDSDPTTLRERVQKELLVDKLQAVSEQMYKDVRARAVISKN